MVKFSLMIKGIITKYMIILNLFFNKKNDPTSKKINGENNIKMERVK